jgi:hypothetical protein
VTASTLASASGIASASTACSELWQLELGVRPFETLASLGPPADQAHEAKGYDVLMEVWEAWPEKLLGGKGYDTDSRRSRRARHRAGHSAEIEPHKTDRIRSRGLQAAQPDRGLRQSLEPVPLHRHPLRQDREGLPLHATRLWIKTVNTAQTICGQVDACVKNC